jgi:ABC-type metal ion transport system substrate-binding protein
MKKLVTILVALFLIFTASEAQTLERFFNKYSNDERFQYVSVGNGMMNLASAFGGIAKNDKDLVSKMKNMKILTLEADENSTLMKSISKEFDQIIKQGNFQTAVEVRDKGDQVHIFYRMNGENNADMLIVTREKDEFTIIWMNGKMTKDEMMKTFSEKSGNLSKPLAKNPEKVDSIS